ELEEYVDSPSYGSQGLLYGAVVFSSLGGDGQRGAKGRWSYSIRLNVSAGTTVFSRIPATRPLDLGLRTEEAKTYLRGGFVSLQLMLDRYIIGHRREEPSGHGDISALLDVNDLPFSSAHESPAVQRQLAESLRYLPQSLETIPMPVAGVVLDGFYELIALVFPLVFIVAFLYTQKKVLNELITEKETKVRESLRMLGVSSTAIIGSWFVTYGLIFGVLCGIFALVASFDVFPYSDLTLIFAFFWLWCMSFLAFAWFIHCFFNNSRTGGIVGMIIMFAQWIVFSSQNREGPPASNVVVLLMLMPNAAFCTGLGMLSKYEAARVGAAWHNLTMAVDNSSFAWVLGMMCVDILLWTSLGWYFDRVLPKEYGVRQPPNFLFKPSYWQRNGRNLREERTMAAELDAAPDAVCAGLNAAEAVPEAVRRRAASGCVVQTRGLRREFNTPGGTKVAVAGLDLTMYQGQVLALLGHNGAGKSTTIHMLTGMVEPTSGEAIVAGHPLRSGLREIRQLIGVCPQHDVLWLELTVGEHLTVYAQLRGVPALEVVSRAREMMQQVGLTEKAMTRAGSLSGGQKRKLSLCLALIGRPAVAFLDEPTSGMDPFSRRSTWNIIRGARDGRVIVLTTHFMDEADMLGDRIAIMAEGVLQCCGSSLFLKARFGAGYSLTCARQQPPEGTADREQTQAQATIEGVIKMHVPEAELLTDVGAELSVRLPSSAASRFPCLLEELDARASEIGLAHYGLSMVTLEEVFLRVASGEMNSLDSRVGGGNSDPGLEQARALRTPSMSPELAGEIAERQNGPGVAARHLGALFMKRARYGRRDFKALACTVLLPVALLAFGLWLLQLVGDRHAPALLLSLAQYDTDVVVPYNASYSLSNGAALPGSVADAAVSGGAHPLAEQLPTGEGFDRGLVFGRQYSAGLP
ncbi:unnamed protein product, partial [Polarella glacialis]